MGVQRIERTELWKSNARILQLRLRDRFRVAVDRHYRRRLLSDEGYFSSIVQRWLTRFRDFRRDTFQSTSVFYRKRVSKDFNSEEDSIIVRMLRSVAVPLLGNMCHVFMNGLNNMEVYGLEKLHAALLHRPKNKSLLTVSNHVASVDDPFIISSLLPPRVLLDAQNLRWTLCATDRCFTNPVTSAFFRTVKVLPVARGDGIYQKGMDMAIAKLNNGGWVHIFPEGSRSRDGGKTIGSAKRGVGRLILDADTVPLVIPFVHTGMQEIMPIGGKLPRIGKTVTVLVGDPIRFDDLLTRDGKEQMSRGRLYDAVASRIGQRLRELKAEVEKLADLESRLEHSKTESTERVSEMLQRIDWDLFGVGSEVVKEDHAFRHMQRQPVPKVSENREVVSSDRYLRVARSYHGEMASKMCRSMDSTELLSFAARGLFTSHGAKETVSNVGNVMPLRLWKQFWEANVSQQWNPC